MLRSMKQDFDDQGLNKLPIFRMVEKRAKLQRNRMAIGYFFLIR